MSKNRNKNSNYKDDAPQAAITERSEKQDSKNAAASAVSADGEDLISLHIRRTNDEPGFRALNPYVRKRLYELTVAYLDKLCERSNFKVDKPYWKKIGGEIIDTGTADEVLIADARAGYGKSTFINAFVLSLIELSRENKEYRSELGGLVISFQKVEDLNRLVNLVGEFFGDTEDIVALQGWTRSGKEEGFCKNPDVADYDQCQPKNCPYAANCQLLSFNARLKTALVVGVTHVRFRMYADSPLLLGAILSREDARVGMVPRRYIIFDESPHLERVTSISTPTFNGASSDFNRLIQRGKTNERSDRYFQYVLSSSVWYVFQHLRGQVGIYPSEDELGQQDAVAGRLTVGADEFMNQRRTYSNLLERISQRKLPLTQQQRELFVTTGALFRGETCVFCRSNGFSIYKILPPEYLFRNQLTLIFDATAAVDEDYAGILSKRFLPRPDTDETHRLTLHVHRNPEMSVTKTSLKASWKIPAFARMIHDVLDDNPVPTYLVTYMNLAAPLYEALTAELPGELLKLITMMPKKEGQLPYFGGTNGSNAFNQCEQMIVLGLPRLTPEAFLTASCAAYGTETVLDELETYQEENGVILTRGWDLLKLPHITDYARHYLVARLEQEIYRTALRNFGSKKLIDVHIFCPQQTEFAMLCDRFPHADVKEHDTVPPYFTSGKALARNYKGGKTHFAQLGQLLRDGIALPVKASEVKARLNLNDNAWKELMRDERTNELLRSYGIARKGTGPAACWVSENAA